MTRPIARALIALAAPALALAAVPAQAATASHVPAAESFLVLHGGNADSRTDSWNHHDRGRHRGWRGGRGYDDDRGYDYNDRRYDDRDYRYDDDRRYCRRSDGTTGIIIGGAAGAVIGREVAGRRGDRTLGTVLGAVGGALIGRQIDRNGSSCR